MNIYLLDPRANRRRGKHVGKRYAKGIFCWDCKKPASTVPNPKEEEWVCFYCGATRIQVRVSRGGSSGLPKDWMFSPADRELGFPTNELTERTGINGAMGFVWALGGNGLGKNNVKDAKELAGKEKKFITEYDEELTQEGFQKILSECIDDEFSFEYFS